VISPDPKHNFSCIYQNWWSQCAGACVVDSTTLNEPVQLINPFTIISVKHNTYYIRNKPVHVISSRLRYAGIFTAKTEQHAGCCKLDLIITCYMDCTLYQILKKSVGFIRKFIYCFHKRAIKKETQQYTTIHNNTQQYTTIHNNTQASLRARLSLLTEDLLHSGP